jgi:electron transport complex protein RnfG
MVKDIIKFGLFLTIVSVIAAGSLSITYILCSPKIAVEKEKEMEASLAKVLPAAASFEKAKRFVDGKEVNYYIGSSNGGKVGVVLAVSKAGYGGVIEMVVAIDLSGRVTGVKVLRLNETPGLGLKAAEEKFLSQFRGRSAESRLKAKYDVQALTGATITTQAVADGVKEALITFKKLKI